MSQHFLMLRAYIATSWFDTCLTSPESLHMWLDVDEINLKYSQGLLSFF